ncbi:MAG: hypothetical protein KGL11_03295 [Alphaproteobacteria bacterium]|nr:hypothetical protein [Alphaproteobacteria bacterium]
MAEFFRISYGAASGEGAPAIELRRGTPLRLSDGFYPFAEPPDLIRLDTTASRLDFLREHLQSLCDLWARPPRQFLDAYFASLSVALAGETARRELTAAGGGLFAPADWSFAALRPLPSAQLPAGDGAVRADFAFWTGASFIAIELPGGRRAKRRDELARLTIAGVNMIELAAADLADAAALAAKLPEPFHDFWRGVKLPQSPFGTRNLAIEPAR